MVQAERDERDVELVAVLLDVLDLHEPTIRMEVVAAARARVTTGCWPSAFDVADTVVADFA